MPRIRRRISRAPKAARARPARRARVVLILGALALLGGGGWFWSTLPSAEPLRTRAPSSTALIDARAEEARKKGHPARRTQRWVPLSRTSQWLQEAVVDSEDARFFDHRGLDVTETRIALQQAWERRKLGRGASTLTQQLAKNLWLGERRTLTRKLEEVVLARRLETLGKDRILELYLNVAEWGDGIYGCEAASRVWFGKACADLDCAESAVLAAMLPAPRRRNPRRPSPQFRERAAQIVELFGMYRQLTPDQLAQVRAELDRLLPPA